MGWFYYNVRPSYNREMQLCLNWIQNWEKNLWARFKVVKRYPRSNKLV